jgi:hypothetical protein
VSSEKKSVATRLVEIAEELFDFGCATEGRYRPGDPEPIVHVFATPKNNPGQHRALPDIRADLAEVYQLTYGAVPTASALGDAMMVLEGRARKATPITPSDSLLESLMGGKSVATRLIAMAEDCYRLGVTTTGEAFAVPSDGPNVARLLRGGRRSLRAELAQRFFAETKTAANAQALADTLLVLEGRAQGMEPTELALRVARLDDGRLVLDLGADDGRVVVIGSEGWEVVASSPVLFWRTRATLPLPIPAGVGGLDRLKALLNVGEGEWPLIVAWLVAALIPDIPHPVLLLKGEHGTAKSWAAKLLTALVDPCASQLRTAPRNVEDWCVAAAGSWATCLDNVSDLQPWLQDAICCAVTGDGLLRRQLYTDSDVSVLAFKRVVALTSIDPGMLNGDLADRLLTIDLERISEDDRAGDEDLGARWRDVHPIALAGLLDLAAQVLNVLPAVRRAGLPRMADFARVLLAVDKVLGTNAYGAYTEQAGRTAEQVADADLVALAIREHITTEWNGTAGELLKRLTPEKPPKDWPTTPQGMGGRLSRAAPTLRRLKWTVERPPREAVARRWRIVPPTEKDPARSSSSSSTSPRGQSDSAGRGVDDGHDVSAGVSSAAPAWCCDRCGRVTTTDKDMAGFLHGGCGGHFQAVEA